MHTFYDRKQCRLYDQDEVLFSDNVSILVEHGADVNARDLKGMTVLMHHAVADCTDSLVLLHKTTKGRML